MVRKEILKKLGEKLKILPDVAWKKKDKLRFQRGLRVMAYLTSKNKDLREWGKRGLLENPEYKVTIGQLYFLKIEYRWLKIKRELIRFGAWLFLGRKR